jgi:hypothetical protein
MKRAKKSGTAQAVGRSGRTGCWAKWMKVKTLPPPRTAVIVFCPWNLCQYTAYWDDGEKCWYHFGGGHSRLHYDVVLWTRLPPNPPNPTGQARPLAGRRLDPVVGGPNQEKR